MPCINGKQHGDIQNRGEEVITIRATRLGRHTTTGMCNTLLARDPLGSWGNSNPITLVVVKKGEANVKLQNQKINA